jgi:hypothetical protein
MTAGRQLMRSNPRVNFVSQNRIRFEAYPLLLQAIAENRGRSTDSCADLNHPAAKEGTDFGCQILFPIDRFRKKT